ncbi:MAG: hypothetical protein UH239_04020 [Acutalibacteraceae bacterium]|nr:hypothetical protein [Acutalibacteraceae bacterium]
MVYIICKTDNMFPIRGVFACCHKKVKLGCGGVLPQPFSFA